MTDLPADDPTRRFSNRVADYVKYRPTYPAAVLDTLAAKVGLRRGWTAADVGSGTGIFTRQLLDYGLRVYGVEPNEDMRAAAETLLAGYPDFTSIAARAEAIPLPDGSVEIVTAAQALHWFDFSLASREFRRLLKPGGVIALVWNTRDVRAPFVAALEALLREYGTDYYKTSHAALQEPDKDAGITGFFAPDAFNKEEFENPQFLTWEQFSGRVLSSSYVPLAGHPNHAPLMAAIDELFGAHQQGGTVALPYVTELYWARVGAGG
ncbi:MAG: class I SAM-dependent methyltransferase [Anaerolineae bacterium]|nr:MAG: class I SAM-dependent methyltransferase [Anaerolineae bacterium]